jgi:Ca-activated chloride channel homolog
VFIAYFMNSLKDKATRVLYFRTLKYKESIFKMRYIVLFTLLLGFNINQAQNDDKAFQASNDLVYEANQLADNDFTKAEMTYREALSRKSTNVAGAYNLGNVYYENGNYAESIWRLKQTVKEATEKTDKHRAYHNLGNALMQTKQCKEAVEAFKNALRNNPTDDETRYNLAVAKECAKEQGSGGGGEDENKDDEKDQDKQDQEQKQGEDENKNQQNNDQQENENNEGDNEQKDKQEGDKEQDEKGKPDDQQQDKGKNEQQQQKPQQQPGKLSPQQIKNILQAINDQEQKTQDKINAQKVKGGKVKTDKDW